MSVIALIIGVLLAATDQIIKYFVLTYLQPVGSVTAIDGLLDSVSYTHLRAHET